jgi:hypothetical protein
MNVLDYINKLQSVRNRLQDETEKIIYNNEDEIIDLNLKQIDNDLGFDNKELLNPKFDGVYSVNNFNQLGEFRPAGTLYTFRNTGEFRREFYIQITPDSTKIIIDSYGTGGVGSKKHNFFKGYNNIFGLTNQNQYILNYEIILPELNKFIKENLK